MAESPVKCELVMVDVTDERENTIALIVPAFTVSSSALVSRVEELTREYITRSEATANSTSLGDFALYLLSQAASDPKEL